MACPAMPARPIWLKLLAEPLTEIDDRGDALVGQIPDVTQRGAHLLRRSEPALSALGLGCI